MSQSPNLDLTYLQAAQAQKHVTVNEALRTLDVLVQLVIQAELNDPPASPNEGQVWLVGTGTGAWQGWDGDLAAWLDGAWQRIAPQEGWIAAFLNDSTVRRLDGSGDWVEFGGLPDDLEADTLGINANFASESQRVVVRSRSSLFDADPGEGGSTQITINKAAAADTAALLFQSDFSGRAEFGLAGENDFSVKVSDDGSSFIEAIKIDAASGASALRDVSADSYGGDGVTQSATDTTAGRLIRADHGWTAGNLLGSVSESGGVPTGAVIERGSNSNGEYVRFADGTQIARRVLPIDVTTTSGQLFQFPASFSGGRLSISTAISHVSGAPNTALAWGNIRAAGHTGSTWAVNLDTAGTSSDPDSDEEKLAAMAFGRWF